ncbi:MAG: IS1595 family transposase [Chloroflexi bacterium]|nr:IS1595 family transposase [Chloroflexota bacterium]MXZ46908.1 IS1595 family transposase [Chloroflexota bacterium]MYB41196.1 IS1595 family transposase [Chloroflexota bacterium]
MVNLLDVIDTYDSDEACRELLVDLRWPGGIACPRCGSLGISTLTKRPVYDCNDCRYQFSVTAGTIMHDSHLPLRKWFIAIYLMCESKKGVSALQLKRTLGVAYQTAWHLCHRIREAMANDPLEGPTLFGVVEVDETLVGGKKRGKGHGYRGNKFWVAGAIQRDGQVRLERVPNVRRRTLHGFIERTVRDEAEAIYTDELASYLGIGDDETRHETVNHSADEWVVGDVHTNSIEGVWSLFKRSLMGSFHKVSMKHIDRYLSELEWRFNNRDNERIFADALRRIVTTDKLTYADLVADEAA